VRRAVVFGQVRKLHASELGDEILDGQLMLVELDQQPSRQAADADASNPR